MDVQLLTANFPWLRVTRVINNLDGVPRSRRQPCHPSYPPWPISRHPESYHFRIRVVFDERVSAIKRILFGFFSLSVCLMSVLCLSFRQSVVYLSVFPPVCLILRSLLPVCLFYRQSVFCLSVSQVCLSVSVCFSVSLLSVFPSVSWVSACLSVFPSVFCLSVHSSLTDIIHW